MKNILRVGRVSSVNPSNCSARVTFEDRSDVVSYELPILVKGSLHTFDYWLPAVHESVLCMFMPNGSAQGFIVGSFYSAINSPPMMDENKRYVAFSDGTSIEYDLSTHTLSVTAEGPIKITATGDIHVTGDVIADGISLKNHKHSGINSPPA